MALATQFLKNRIFTLFCFYFSNVFECFLNYLLFILMCMYLWCSTNKNIIQIKSKTFEKKEFQKQISPLQSKFSRIIYLHFLLYIMFGFVFLFLAYCKYLLICQSFLCGASRIHAHCNCFGALSLDHLVRLRQWEHSKKSRTTRKYNSQAFVFAWANLFGFIVCLHVFFCA